MASSDFTTVFFDDFNGNSLDRSIWNTVYSGTYWNDAFSWTPDQIEVGGGQLTIPIEDGPDGWTSGGISTIPDGQSFGSYEFRARIEPGQGTAAAILLWPSDNSWSDEVDIIETNRGDRDGFAFTNHGNPWETQYIDVDVSNWHTYRLEWTPGELLLTVDGREVGRMTNDVPTQQMSFGIQGMVMTDADKWFGGGPNGSTPSRVDIEVDWVHVSAYTPGEGAADEGGQAQGRRPAASPAMAADDEAWDEEADADAGDGAADGPVPGLTWMEAAEMYLAVDGDWEGSWANQVEAGQITVEDVAYRLQAGEGTLDPWA
jgi:hypothetical protein